MYEVVVAPLMFAQLDVDVSSPESASQRSHWNLYEIGCVPRHVPCLPASVLPTIATPEMTGGATSTGQIVPDGCAGQAAKVR
jgi:hypothetical protein